MCNSPVSQPPVPITPAGSISTITVGILPPAKVLAEDLTKATLREGLPSLLKVTPKFISWKTTNKVTHPHNADHPSGPKDGTALSSRWGVSAACSSVPGSSGGAAGSSGQGPGEPKQELPISPWWSQMMMSSLMIPHQIIPTEEVFTIQPFPERILRDSMKGTFYKQR